MGRNKNFFFQNRYWISGVRYSVLLENPGNMGKAMINIIKEHNLDTNINWRFKKFDKSKTEKGSLEIEDNLHIDYLNKIKNILKIYSQDLEDYDNIVVTGGVAKLLENNKLSDEITLLDKLIEIIGVEKGRVHVLENPAESNIDGAMLLLKDTVNKGA